MVTKEELLAKDLVINNIYLKKYINICNNGHKEKQPNLIYQKHHIIPRYYYKAHKLKVDNTDNNVVSLDLKSHILAHYYLIYCSKSNNFKLNNIHAFNKLTSLQGHYLPESELEPIIRKAEELEKLRLSTLAVRSKEINSGGKYINKDGIVKHIKLEEVSDYLAKGWKLGNPKAAAKASLGHVCVTNGTIFKQIKPESIDIYLKKGWWQGKPKLSEETKLKISKNTKGHICNTKGKIVINDGNSNKFILKQELDNYLNEGWKIGSCTKGMHFKTPIKSKGYIHITDGTNNKMIPSTDLTIYEKLGYYKGFITKRSKK